jgi:anti-sigma regulatory factor (Ser/Thr protein kinase)
MEEKRTGSGFRETERITLPAMIESCAVVTAFIDRELEKAGCPVKAMMQINIAMDEIITNIASYAYAEKGGQGNLTVHYRYNPEEDTAEITFTDEGEPFDPLSAAEPDVTLSAEEREVGGLGIFLVRKTMDGVEYRREDGMNVLTIRKKLHA